MRRNQLKGLLCLAALTVGAIVLGHPFPPLWQNGSGPAVHYPPVAWPNEPVSAASCGATCGDWKPYTRFNRSMIDPRVQDPSNGGTAPQNYVNVSSSCSDKQQPSIYYHLHQDGADPDKDVIMFRWRVEQPAHNYATGPSAGNYSASSPWSSALWTVLFDIDGSGYRSLAAHLNGSSGSPAEPVDMLAGIWSNTPDQSIDYSNPNIHLLAHNPTAFIGATGKLLNYRSALNPTESWPSGAAETVWDYGTTRATLVTTSPCTEYFIDYQIPVAMLDASSFGGPKITRDTPISMLFCTANSLSNPFQKDCAINRQWTANAAAPAPFGDYLSFNKQQSYQQPIVSSVTAAAPTSCPGTYTLNAKVQDTLALQNGVVVPSMKTVQFYYWQDRNGDGQATTADTGSAWTRITPAATLVSQTLNTWTASWDATALAKGKYLIGVQAVDNATVLDDGMTSNGIDNRTFSYLTGDADNKVYVDGAWASGQQAAFPAHSPVQAPGSTENWYGNPSVTGNQVALVGTAINSCGVAPTINLSANVTSVAAGATVGFTVTVANPTANSSPIDLNSISDLLPTGFAYVSSSSSGANGIPSIEPTANGQQLTWTFGAPVSIAPGASATLNFSATATSTAGTYSDSATAVTSFGTLTAAPVQITVDSARLSLSMSPSAYSIAADGSTALVYTLNYANISGVPVTAASISNVLPAGVTYSACSGGTSCSNSAGTVTWNLGTLTAGASGTATLTITVPSNYATFSVANSATLSATAPDTTTVNASASATVAVTGVAGAGTPAFTLTKSASAVTVAPGGSITYTLNYANYGTASASSVVLTDTLPAGTSYSSCSDSCLQSSGTITWNIGTVAAGASGSRTVTVTAANPFTSANPSVNAASINWFGGSPVTAQVSVGVTGQACSTYYFQNASANVGSDGTQPVASTTPVPISSNTGATVTATAPNSGASFLEVLRFYQDPQTTNDVPFDGNITTNIYIDRANGQGLNIRTTVYDYNSSNGAKTLLAQNTTLFNGSTKGLLSYTVTPSGTLQKGHRLLWVYEARSNHNSQTVQVQFQYAGTVTNGISGGTTFANSNATYCVTPPANLVIGNTVSSASIAETTTPLLTYTLRYANTGGASATNTSLVAALPTGSTNCEYSTNNSVWSACSSPGAAPPSHTFSLGSVAGGAGGTVYVRGNAPSSAGGATLTGTAALTSDQTTAVNASAVTNVIAASVGGTADLALNLSADRTTAAPGANVVYTVTAINTGSAAATNVVISNVVPSAAYYTYDSCTGGCGAAGSTLTWPTINSLAAGASQSFTYTMRVGTSGLPSGITTISDSAGATATGLSATSNSVAVTLNGNPVLSLLNVASPSSGLSPGDTVTYTLTVANSGAADANVVTLVNPIAANTTFSGNITASTGTGNFDAVANQVTFNVGTLASGASATLSFQVLVNAPLPSGPTTLSSTASLSASNAAQQSVTASASASASAVLSVIKTAPSSVAFPSAVLTAAAAGTQLFVDRTDRLQVGQFIKIGSQVARIVALSSRSISVDGSISAISGTAVNAAVTLAITYRNTGDANATGVTLRETLANGFGYYSATPTPTSTPISGSNGDVDWTLGTLNAGASATAQVIVFPTGLTGSLSNTATLSAANSSSASATTVTAVGGLSVAKTTSTATVSAGTDATYSIIVSNSLGSSVAPITVSDVLPDGFSYKTGSATVAGIATEPTFTVDDTSQIRPTWTGLTVPAAGSLAINFQAQVAGTSGAASYQNQVDVGAPAGVGVMGFDALLTTSEDVTVLAAASGVLKGYVYRRDSGGNALPLDATTDTPLTGVEVRLHKQGANCVNPVGATCFVTYTDSNGYFERVVPAEDWIVSVMDGTGELTSGWRQVSGDNDDTVTVPDQASVLDYNGFSSTPAASHLVSTSAGAGGTLSPTSATVTDGSTTTFTVTPDSGFNIASISGCGGSLVGTTYTTDLVTAACTVTATFINASIPAHLVTATASSGGTITPGSIVVAQGTITSFTLAADAGHHIDDVSGCGGSLTGNVYTTGAINAVCTVNATFAPDPYFVTASAGTGGTISPPGISVTFGSTTAFTVTPDAAHDILSVTGCGGSLAGTTYTTGTVTGACAVSASFVLKTYNVQATAGSGGTVSPSNIAVSHGNATSFTLTPNANYAVSAASGCAGSLNGNVYTTGAIAGACSVTVTFAALGPQFEPATPHTMNARSLFTDVPLNIAPRAIDASGAEIEVTLVGETKLRPGRHTLTWRAQDDFGHVITTQQLLDIWPTISLSNDFSVSYGSSASFRAVLNGEPPQYPHAVAFAVGGDGGLGSRHTLAPTTITFNTGTEATVNFDTLPQNTSLPTQHLIVTLDPTANIGARGTLDISLISENAAPLVSIIVSQEDRLGTLVARNSGAITLHAIVDDPNSLDTHSFQWTYPAGTTAQASSDGFELSVDALTLKAGLNEFSVLATDSGVPALANRGQVALAVLETAPVLGTGDTNANGTSDRDEGWGDAGNGIPAYLNRSAIERGVLPEDAPVTDKFLIEGDAGARLKVGVYAQLAGAGGARLQNSSVATFIGSDVVTNTGGYFDLQAQDLAALGQVVTFVIPQRQPIPAQPIYRLWDARTSRWVSFLENTSNKLSSAAGSEGYCPPPGSVAYEPGLKPGDWCVQVAIEDGGPNDADHQRNGALMKSGGVGELENTIVTGTSGRGGGGAVGMEWLLFATLALVRRLRRRVLCFLLAMLPVAVFAQKADSEDQGRGFYVSFTAAQVRSTVDAADMDARLAAQGFTTDTRLSGESRFGAMLDAGYRWRYFGVELGYAHLGKLHTVVEGTTPVDDDYLRAISLAHPRSGAGPRLCALAFIPLGERWELFGRAGGFYWRTTMSAEGRGRFTDVQGRQLDPVLGLGARFKMSERTAIVLEFDRYRLDGENVNAAGIGILYRPWRRAP